MNAGELKREIMGLAFETPEAMQEYRHLALEAANRAIRLIAGTVRPVLGQVRIEKKEAVKADYVRYELGELTRQEGGGSDYLGPVVRVALESEDGRYEASAPYRMEGRSTLLLRGEDVGTFTVWYQRSARQITGSTPDEEELDLDRDLHVLVPLLAAFYVWLDDDERKAVMYYNQYEDVKQQLAAMGAERPTATVREEMRW